MSVWAQEREREKRLAAYAAISANFSRVAPKRVLAFAKVRLVLHHASRFGHNVVILERVHDRLQQMDRHAKWCLLRLTVVMAEHGLYAARGFVQAIVRDLREHMVHNMGSNVVMDMIDKAVVPVEGRERAP